MTHALHYLIAARQCEIHELTRLQGTSALVDQIAYVLQGLEALPALRRLVAEQKIDHEPATQGYIRLVAGLLTLVFEAADSATNPGISRLLIAMFHFMQGKEFAGQERAAGASMLSAGRSHVPGQQHWLHLIDSQERCLQVFAECAPAAPLALWRAACDHSPELTCIERLRRVGCTAAPETPLDPELSQVWFDACTQRMNTMQQIETALAAELLQRCEAQLHSAQAALTHPQDMLPPAEIGPDALPDFFNPAHHPASLEPGTDFAPQLGRSVMQLVQEQSMRLQSVHHELETVRSALTERKTVERAKGLLMSHRAMSEAEAHKLLRQTAMNQNRRLVEVAQAMLAMADLLPPASR